MIKPESVGSRFIAVVRDKGIGADPDHPAPAQRFAAAIPHRIARAPQTNYQGITGVFSYWMTVTLDEICETAELGILLGRDDKRRTLRKTLESVDRRARRLKQTRPFSCGSVIFTSGGFRAYEAFKCRYAGHAAWFPTRRLCGGNAYTEGVLWPFRVSADENRGVVTWAFIPDGDSVPSRRELPLSPLPPRTYEGRP